LMFSVFTAASELIDDATKSTVPPPTLMVQHRNKPGRDCLAIR